MVGTFQGWDFNNPLALTGSGFVDPADNKRKGTVYEATTRHLEPGFYEYKYLVTFQNTERRLIGDPCARYGGTQNQNSAFLIGGHSYQVPSYKHKRRPLRDLVIYELMIDDFTANLDFPNECPVARIQHRLQDLKDLGINAIEFMPWMTNMRSDVDGINGYSWGYDPIQYFSVAHRYTDDPRDESKKLSHLKELIKACHELDIQVILDVVLNHADAADPSRGFPYYWLYEEPSESPYVGQFAQAAFYRDLDYDNQCTFEYIRDALIYWIDEFGIDGLRFDNTLGLYDPNDPHDGLPEIIQAVQAHLETKGETNFPLILEHSWDYGAIDVVNRVHATACWLDPFRSLSGGYLRDSQIEAPIMRMLNSGSDFASGCPITYVENHDHKRFACIAGGREDWFRMQPYLIALFTSAGAPLLFNGQEFGADNDMPEDGPGRVIPRPLDWKWLQSDEGLKVNDLFRKLIKIRHEHPALRTSNFYPSQWEDSWTLPNESGFGIHRDKNLVIFHRWNEHEKLYIALNFGDQLQRVHFEVPFDGPWTNLLSGAVVKAENGLISTAVTSNWGAIYWAPVKS